MLSKEYIAGLFDGEGFFTFVKGKVSKRYTTRPYRFSCIGAIVMREKHLLEAVRDSLGYGSISLGRKETDKHCEYWKILFQGERLKAFCKEIGPYLVIKKDRADLIYQVCLIKNEIGNQPVSDKLYEKQERIWLELKDLNRKGPTVAN